MSSLNIFSESKGSGEAVSQALLFIIVIGAMSGISLAGTELITATEEKQSVKQNVNSFQLLDEKIIQLTDDHGLKGDSKAVETVNIRTYDSTLTSQDKTTINIGSYSFTSDPIKFTGDKYEVRYDTGIIATEINNETTVVQYPTIQPQNNDIHTLSMRPTTYSEFTNYGSNRLAQLAIERPSTPETARLAAGQNIIIETNNIAMWESYLKESNAIQDVNTDRLNGEVTGELTKNTKVYYHSVRII